MSTNTKLIVGFFIVVIAIAVLYYFLKPENKEQTTTTTNQTKSGLSSLNLSGLLGGLFGGPKTVTSDSVGSDPIKQTAQTTTSTTTTQPRTQG